MFCPNCGKPIDDNARVCPACGYYISPDPAYDNNPAESFQEPTQEMGQGSGAGGPEGPNRRMGLIIALIVIIVAVVVVLVLCLTGVIPVGNRNGESAATTEVTEVNEVEGSVNNTETTTAQTETAHVAPDSSYVGYWNISGSNEEELTITSVSGSAVEFSLWWYNLFLIDNATATVNSDNICTFTYTDGGITIAGNLTFYDGYIAVQITESGMEYIQPGTMVFSEKHLESWSEEEMAEKNSSSSSSSSASSDSDSSSSSNQSSNTASSNSGTNTTVYYYVYSGDYVIPYSSSQYLTYSDIQYLTPSELRIARNEIYARHGRLFDDSSLQAYFNSKSWYHGYIAPSDFKQSMLSSLERSNVAFIESYE